MAKKRKFRRADYEATEKTQITLGEALPDDHLARFIVSVVGLLDLSEVYSKFCKTHYQLLIFLHKVVCEEKINHTCYLCLLKVFSSSFSCNPTNTSKTVNRMFRASPSLFWLWSLFERSLRLCCKVDSIFLLRSYVDHYSERSNSSCRHEAGNSLA